MNQTDSAFYNPNAKFESDLFDSLVVRQSLPFKWNGYNGVVVDNVSYLSKGDYLRTNYEKWKTFLMLSTTEEEKLMNKFELPKKRTSKPIIIKEIATPVQKKKAKKAKKTTSNNSNSKNRDKQPEDTESIVVALDLDEEHSFCKRVREQFQDKVSVAQSVLDVLDKVCNLLKNRLPSPNAGRESTIKDVPLLGRKGLFTKLDEDCFLVLMMLLNGEFVERDIDRIPFFDFIVHAKKTVENTTTVAVKINKLVDAIGSEYFMKVAKVDALTDAKRLEKAGYDPAANLIDVVWKIVVEKDFEKLSLLSLRGVSFYSGSVLFHVKRKSVFCELKVDFVENLEGEWKVLDIPDLV